MRQFTAFTFLFYTLLGFGQVPEDYYQETEGLTGYELKTKLHEIISNGHNEQGYSALWSFLNANDIDSYYENDGTVLDIYSENPSSTDPYNFTPSTHQCGSYSSEGDCYNREHSFPKSWFGGKVSPMYSDVHHIFATDGKVNSIRGNFPYGNVGTVDETSQNGSKLGDASSTLGYSGKVFEPIDEFKGDVARAYFYMATRYEDKVAGWENNTTFSDAVLDGSSDQVFEDWAVALLLSWHESDPISQKEIDRNNAAYNYQGNGNPFIDHPEFVDSIWGNGNSGSSQCDYYFPASEDNPVWYEAELTSSDTTDYTSHSYSVFRLISDTTINAKLYAKLVSLETPNTYIGSADYLGAVRSDSCGIVYYIPKDGNEYVLYDFSKETKDTIYSNYFSESGIDYYEVVETDSILLPELGYRKKMVVHYENQYATWIEGIGSTKGILWPLLPENYCLSSQGECQGHMLTCQYQQNVLAYSGWEGDCFYDHSTSTSSTINTNNIKVFPQPASTHFTIYNPENILCRFTLYNTLGKEILDFESDSQAYEVNTRNWTGGLYILRITNLDNNKYRALPVFIQ